MSELAFINNIFHNSSCFYSKYLLGQESCWSTRFIIRCIRYYLLFSMFYKCFLLLSLTVYLKKKKTFFNSLLTITSTSPLYLLLGFMLQSSCCKINNFGWRICINIRNFIFFDVQLTTKLMHTEWITFLYSLTAKKM